MIIRKWTVMTLIAGLSLRILCANASGLEPRVEDLIIDAVDRNVPDPSLRPCFVRLLRAIRDTENGWMVAESDSRAVGVEKQADWCAAICWKRWQEWTVMSGSGDVEPWLCYLGRRYCPVNSEVWVSNIVWMLEHRYQ